VSGRISLNQLLFADPADEGCFAGADFLAEYVELELAGEDPAINFPGLAAHLRACPDCPAVYEGVLEAARAELSGEDG
jgi:predicted anti-sigma-YlaC factor YlaD